MDPTNPDPALEFEEDPRYAVANHEAWWAVAYWVAFTVVVTGSAWALGYDTPAEELDFVLGFPTWFFWSVLMSSVAFSIVPVFVIRRWFTDMPLSADGSHDPAAEGR